MAQEQDKGGTEIGNAHLLWFCRTYFIILGTFIPLKVVDIIMGLRVSDQEERLGLNLSQQNESEYAL